MKYSLFSFALILSGCGDVACFEKSELAEGLAKALKPELEEREISILGNTVSNLENLKQECEKNLTRDQECVMIYDFVAVKNGEAK